MFAYETDGWIYYHKYVNSKKERPLLGCKDCSVRSFLLQLMTSVRHWLFFQLSSLLNLYPEVLMHSGNEIFSYGGPYGTSINKNNLKPCITFNNIP